MGRGSRQAGDKLGPKLVDLAVQATLASRRGLAPHEARVRQAATQAVIDRAGHEIADLYRPIVNHLIDGKEDLLHPHMVDFLRKAASGHDQWQAISGLAMGSVSGALGTFFNNALAPAVYSAVRLSPNLRIDQNTAAAAVAAGIIPYAEGQDAAGGQGYDSGVFELLYRLAQHPPDVGTLYDLVNRGLMPEADAEAWLRRQGYDPGLHARMMQLRKVLLAPADAALAVLRGNMSAADGQAAAAAAGVSEADFQTIIGNTGEPPAIEEMLSLWRRGKINKARLERAIKQSRVRDEWIPDVEMMGVIPPSTSEVLDALLQGQVDEATVKQRYIEAGGDPTWFTDAFNTRGSSPTPVQLTVMANRGIIPWSGTGPQATTYEQGFKEGAWRNKWSPAFRKLAEYHPPAREISTLVKEGGLTETEALKLWEEQGLTPELSMIYWKAAHYTRLATPHHLAQTEIVKLYTDHAITENEASVMLVDVGWSKQDAAYILLIADMQRDRAALERAIERVHSSFVAHKITATSASAALGQLDITSKQAETLIGIWQLEQASNVKVLTAAEICDAWYYQIIDQPSALTMLQNLGYSADDALIVLQIKNKGPLTATA